MRVGYFGGSFDPIHFGHLIAAQDAAEQLEVQHLVFVPAAQAPLRSDAVRARAADRLAMIHLAIDDDPRFEVTDIEIERGGVSYTIDTVSLLRKANASLKPIWIIGEDQLGKLPQWHRVEELCQLAEFAVLERPGHNTQTALPELPGLRLHRLRSHQIEISSSEIRRRVREKRPFRFLLPDPVINYINERSLYH